MADAVNAEEWVDHFLASDRKDQVRLARHIIRNATEANDCWMGAHTERLARLAEQRRSALAACQEVYEASAAMSTAGSAAAVATTRRIAAALGTTLWPA